MAAALAAGAVALPIPGLPRARPAKPLPLRPGDVVGLVEPASHLDDPAGIERVLHTIRGMGLVPRVGANVEARHGYLAGTDAQRAADYNAMVSDPEIRAIFAVRGGWGSARMLPLVDWDAVRANPKLLIGFSDITALHLAIGRHAGFATLHAPNGASSWPNPSWEGFWRLAFASETPTIALAREGSAPPVALSPGQARGRLLGGNLTVLSTLMGTEWLPDFTGAILFLEDVGEDEYRIDRMLTQLALAGVLGQVSGVIFGQCTNCRADVEGYTGLTLPQIYAEHLGSLGVPVVTGANIGHVRAQLSLPSGGMVELDADAASLRVLEPITAYREW